MENRAVYLFESYFANTLTREEAQELEMLRTTNPEVASELNYQQQLARSMRTGSLAQGIQNDAWKAAASPLKAKIQARSVPMWPRFMLASAAAIALLIAAIIFLQSPDIQEVLVENTKDYPNKMTFKSLGQATQTVPNEVLKAFSLYDQEDYPAAAKAFQAVVANYPAQLDYRFYWGVALVKNKTYSEAIVALKSVASAENEYQIPAKYYLGLAQAGTGDIAKARQNLEAYQASAQGVTYRKAAQKVLDALPN